MPLKNIRALFMLFILLALKGASQQFYFKNYSADNGLPFVQVYAMFQDSKGFLYTGGYSGMSRFDGKEFTNLTTNNGLIDNYVNTIGEDADGRILVGTKKGINIIENNKVSKGKIINDLFNISVLSIKKSQGSKVFIGTSKGLFQFEKNTMSGIKGTEGFQISDILISGDTVYCASNRGMLIFSGGELSLVSTKNGLSNNTINCLAITSNKRTLAIGTANGLNFYDITTRKIVSYFIENGLIDNTISCLLYDKGNDLWIGSQSGLIKMENNEFNFYNIYYDNNSNLIRCLIKDSENNMWVGTHSGLYRYRDNSFSTFDKINGPGNAFIFEIFKAGSDLFICSENNGIYKYAQGYFKRYGMADGMPSNVSRSGAVTSKGRVFFETDGGVVELKNEKFNRVPVSRRIKAPHYKLFCDRSDVLWLGGVNGVSTFSFSNTGKIDTNFILIPTDQEDYSVTDICEDDMGNKWLAVYQAGLYRVKNGEIINYGKKLGIETREYVSVRASKNKLYVGTLNGLLVIDLKTEGHNFISSDDGLISDIIYSVGFAKNRSTLWIGTNIGISELNVTEFEKNNAIRINSYGKNEGFAGIECNSNGVYEDTDGTVWFGTISGLIKHIPNKYQHNTTLNRTNIYKYKIGDADTLLVSDTEIPYRNNNITFYYRGICFTNPDKVLYSKMLVGYDKEYSLPSEENNAKYTNLAPGTYTFKVISCNNEGVWDTTPTSFVFKILTPFYRTWWFILFSTVFVLLAVYIVFKLRLNTIKQKQQKAFERKVEISRIELKALRSQMNPHFVFNSLNSIQHYIFNSKSDEAVKYLNKFAKLMRVILNNSDKPTVAIEDDLEALKLYLELEQMRFEDKFEYKIEVDDNVDLDYDIMPPMLLQPYVENAILHGLTPKNEKGLLTIGIRNEDQFIVCTITDNGIGRKKAAEIKRTMPGSKHKSLGMKITEERLRILNEISMSKHSVKITDLENADGSSAGTRVELYVPIL